MFRLPLPLTNPTRNDQAQGGLRAPLLEVSPGRTKPEGISVGILRAGEVNPENHAKGPPRRAEGGIRGKGRCGQCGPQAAFQSATAAQRRHLAQRSALRETSPMTPGQARFVDPAGPRHPTRERQRVLGCRSMQVSGAGVESHAPPTDAGVGKGGVPLFSPSFGYFSWRSKKSTNIPCDLGPQPQETACGRDGEKGRCGHRPLRMRRTVGAQCAPIQAPHETNARSAVGGKALARPDFPLYMT